MTQQNLQPITRELIGALRQTGAQVQENEPMSLHTSFQIGGPADVFATVSDERSLRGVLKLCKEAGAPVYVIGNGSDLLIPDQGLRGVVVGFGGDLCRLRLENETTIVCGPGATLAKLCKFALENSLTGLENPRLGRRRRLYERGRLWRGDEGRSDQMPSPGRKRQSG